MQACLDEGLTLVEQPVDVVQRREAVGAELGPQPACVLHAPRAASRGSRPARRAGDEHADRAALCVAPIVSAPSTRFAAATTVSQLSRSSRRPRRRPRPTAAAESATTSRPSGTTWVGSLSDRQLAAHRGRSRGSPAARRCTRRRSRCRAGAWSAGAKASRRNFGPPSRAAISADRQHDVGGRPHPGRAGRGRMHAEAEIRAGGDAERERRGQVADAAAAERRTSPAATRRRHTARRSRCR